MSTINVNYSAMAGGADGLLASWRRIEQHLADLQKVVGATASMDARTLDAYRALFLRWTTAADERQRTLQALADAVRAAGEHYRAVDTALAAQFG